MQRQENLAPHRCGETAQLLSVVDEEIEKVKHIDDRVPVYVAHACGDAVAPEVVYFYEVIPTWGVHVEAAVEQHDAKVQRIHNAVPVQVVLRLCDYRLRCPYLD